MRVLLADDHDLVRETIAAYLVGEGFVDVRSVADLGAALAAVGAEPAFDIILLDYQMPGMNGLDGLVQMRAAAPGVPVAIISGHVQRELAEAALRSGAAGFVPKTLSARAVIAALRIMVTGETFAPVALMQGPEAEGPGGLGSLTRRERDVLLGICAGKSNKEIARDLDLQEVTVKLHVKTLTRKISARNRTHAAMIARNAGLG